MIYPTGPSTDDRLRRLFREARHDPLMREAAKAEMARAGLDREAIRANVRTGLVRAFVDMMDYAEVRSAVMRFVPRVPPACGCFGGFARPVDSEGRINYESPLVMCPRCAGSGNLPCTADLVEHAEWGSLFRANSRSETVGIRVFYPTDDEIVDMGGRLDLRFVISASLKERALAIECVEECFPGAVVVSSAVANGQKPPRAEDLKPINDEELEETPKHRRGKWI